MSPLQPFSAPTRTWFERTFGAPSPPQAKGWPAIARGEHTLILSPTGSGKTLAAFLFCLDRVTARPDSGVHVLYVSPLKALANDVHRNLEQPLEGIRATATELGLPAPDVTLGLRTGDTPPAERARQLRRPPHVLCTTPESLYLMMTSRARETLRGVRYLIVDEIHALAGNKRGAHLALTLERLDALIATSRHPPPVRIGLSATQRPLEAIAAYLGGDRSVTIVDAAAPKALELAVDCPVEDLRKLPEASIWPALAPHLAGLIGQHRTTLVFVNDRRSAERLCASINEVLGKPVARAHHGALSRQAREEVEKQLKAGALPALVCTSSLELGIDIGTIDLVVQVSSPGGVARGLQRIGRAGHVVGATSRGRILARFRGDLLECAAVARAIRQRAVEPTRVPEKCLDVLAQQIVAMAAVEEWPVDELHRVVRRAWPYRDLSRAELDAVLEMLGGRYPAEQMTELRPRVVWDRQKSVVRARPGSLSVAVTSGGTIPDKGLYPVELGDGGPKLGELDEEFVFESRVGNVFQLGTGSWRIERIGANKVTVSPAPGEPPALPFWKGEGLGRTAELGLEVGALCRRYEEQGDAQAWLVAEHCLDGNAARNLVTYLADQRAATAVLPTDKRVVVEHFVDDLGDARVAIHSPLGRGVNTPLAVLLGRRLAEAAGADPQFTATDDGILFRLPAAEVGPPRNPLALLDGIDVERALLEELGRTTLFGARFRENAARALLLPRRGPGKRTPLYLQRMRAQDLLQSARRHPDFPILVETVRECLRDQWDLPRLRGLLADIAQGRVEVAVAETRTASPFATGMLFGFVASFLYEDDLPRAERRAQLLPVGRGLLSSMLGPGELRDLLDPGVLADEEARASRTSPQLKARNADEVHDLLVQLGPMPESEIARRVVDPERTGALLSELGARAQLLGDRWYATDDVERLKRMDEVAWVRRALRAGGPSTLFELRQRALPVEIVQIEEALAKLVASGDAVKGLFRAESREDDPEYVDAEMLDRLHRRSLAAARRAVRPVAPEVYADFLLHWQHLAPAARAEGPGGLERVLDGLSGFALPSELAEREVIARRVRGYEPGWLDRKISDGEFAFACQPTGGGRAPRVAFFARADVRQPATFQFPPETAEARVVAHLDRRGASFFSDLWHATELDASALADALWDLLGNGVITNDRFEVLRRGRAGIGPGELSTFRAGRASRVTPRFQSGRWSLMGAVPHAADAEWWALKLLDRYGVVGREHVEAERPPVAFRELIDVWKKLELRGEVRRGYFVEGWSGGQFAWPQAVEALRAERPVQSVLVSATDPACAWGSLLPFELPRIASNFMVIEAGRPVLSYESGARRVRVQRADALSRAGEALATLGGVVEIEESDGRPVIGSALDAPLRAAGFEPDGPRLRRSPLRVRPLQG